ncbi:hypothetical protein [Stenotrophomonas sp. NRRL B-14846]|uniref:hypothetical protein n=1 Tax=Stenotrophomonas sp. NRRL B-14846 TaxID=3162882 RepID=UPI003D26E88C
MICNVSRGVLLAVMVASAGAANAVSTSPVSLMSAAEQASLIETRYSAGDGAPVAAMTTRYFANDELSVSWDDQQVLVLCKEAAYLKIPAAKLKADALTTEQRQMITYQAVMSGLGRSQPWPKCRRRGDGGRRWQRAAPPRVKATGPTVWSGMTSPPSAWLTARCGCGRARPKP